jgi:CheY-like chemotaxis protein
MARVLLVDNDRTTVNLLKILLELDGYTVSLCSVVAQVLAEVERQAPDIVLMDVFLTRADDGLDLLRQIRANPATRNLPVLMTSGMELSEECARAGANGFLLKPYSPELLTSTMKRSLDHKRSSKPPEGPA